MNETTRGERSPDDLAATTIRELTQTHPEVLSVLAPLGIDLCCGGAHPLGEALDLHGLDRTAVLDQVARLLGLAAPSIG